MKRALFIGRFQPFHNAHLIGIKKILKEADEVIIAIGSSQEKNILENPFSYIERKNMMSKTLKNNKIKNFKIYPVPDLYNDKKWVDYIKNNLPKYDFVYSGNIWTLMCFKKYDSKTLENQRFSGRRKSSGMRVSSRTRSQLTGFSRVKKIKLIKGISSTIIRSKMIKNKNWKKLVPKEVADYIEKIKGVERVKKIYSKSSNKPFLFIKILKLYSLA